MTIQERLDELNPYVSTIRYDKTPVVEVEFPVDWGVPKSESISFKAIKEDVETKTVTVCCLFRETKNKY